MSYFSLAKGYMLDKRNAQAYNKEDDESVKDRIVIVTGANSGLGKISSTEMAKRGATVIMACRDGKRGQEALDDIKKKVPEGKLVLMQLDLEDFNSVRSFAEKFKKEYSQVNILIANGGVNLSSGKREIANNDSSLEMHMSINHLGHFLLVNLLTDHLKKGAPSRVIVTSSTMAQVATLDVDDIMLDKVKSFRYDAPYCNSKMANMLFAYEFGKRMTGSGVKGFSFCPGLVSTQIFRNQPWYEKLFTNMGLMIFGVAEERAVETILTCALSKSLGDETGKIYRFNQKWELMNKYLEEHDEISEKLWKVSEVYVGLKN